MPQPVQQPGPGDGQLLLSLCVDEPGRLDLLHLHHHLLIVGRQLGCLQLELELQLLPWHSGAGPLGGQHHACIGQVLTTFNVTPTIQVMIPYHQKTSDNTKVLPRPGNDGERAEDEVDQHERGGGQQQAEGGSQHCAPGICNDIYQLKILSSNRRTLCYHAHLA